MTENRFTKFGQMLVEAEHVQMHVSDQPIFAHTETGDVAFDDLPVKAVVGSVGSKTCRTCLGIQKEVDGPIALDNVLQLLSDGKGVGTIY